MSNSAQTLEPHADGATRTERLEYWLPWILCASAIFVLFFQLGGAALFEPDEGRNAEKAREILFLGDWITPHENFHPVLDKPIAFYWMIALSYKFFGVSEWAARLPSALAALGCLALVYFFTRAHWSKMHALWSALILLTSLEFFMLARIVIFDMPLTFFLTLSLAAFYQASHSDDRKRRRMLYLLMYSALGIATLIKGLIGVIVPGMVIFSYLLLTRQWSLLRRMELLPGALLFLAIVLPWYLQMGARHEGYLVYYFWDEHFGRFASDAFDRTQPWFYFILVLMIGFFPWSLLGPFLVSGFRRWAWDDKTLFLLLWVGLPFLFFSASKSKLPHYILPIFPPLAILTAARLVALFQQSAQRAPAIFSLTWVAYGGVVLYFLIGHWQPAILPKAIVPGVTGMPRYQWIFGVLILVLAMLLSLRQISRRLQSQPRRYVAQALVMVLFVVFSAQSMTAASTVRSAQRLGEQALLLMVPQTQVVLYDTYLAGLAFYLSSAKPVWVVSPANKKRTFLGNYYALGGRAGPPNRWGKALFDFDEFAQQWRSTQQPLLIVLKEKSRARLEALVGAVIQEVGRVDDYLLLAKP